MTFEQLFKNAETLTKEYGEDVTKAFKSILTMLQNEGKSADEAVEYVSEKLKEMK